jgi:hypothetical protein
MEPWVNKAPQYSCNYVECVKALGVMSRKDQKKVAPEQ